MRVPALSAGAGGSSTFVHAVSQQVLKQAEIQSLTGNQVLLTPFVANCQRLPRVSLSQTPRSFRFFQIFDECLAADHRCLVPNADQKLAAATYPILGWDGPHWVPAPRMLRDVVWSLTRACLQVAVSMCEKAVFRRCSAARPPLGAEISEVSPSGAIDGPYCLMLSVLFLATALMLLPTSRVSTRCTRVVCAP